MESHGCLDLNSRQNQYSFFQGRNGKYIVVTFQSLFVNISDLVIEAFDVIFEAESFVFKN